MIVQARAGVARAVDSALTMLYWQVGARVPADILKEMRAEYGAEIVSALGRQLEAEFGRGSARRTCATWCSSPRRFPTQRLSPHCGDNWAGPTSRAHLPSRTRSNATSTPRCAASSAGARGRSGRRSTACSSSALRSRKKPDGSSAGSSPRCARRTAHARPGLPGSLLLDFLGLKDTYSEKDLESRRILREIERFLLELGAGFAFVERQKRITLDGDDYYIDLLFFHRRLRRLVSSS